MSKEASKPQRYRERIKDTKKERAAMDRSGKGEEGEEGEERREGERKREREKAM